MKQTQTVCTNNYILYLCYIFLTTSAQCVRYFDFEQVIENHDSFCGKRSQKQIDLGDTDFGANYGKNFEGGSNLEPGQSAKGYDTELYPWMCTGYKIPNKSHPHMLIRLKNCEGSDKTLVRTSKAKHCSYRHGDFYDLIPL